MKKLFLFLIILISFHFATEAQITKGVCGTSIEDQRQTEARLVRNIATSKLQGTADRGALKYIPIHYHRVGDSNSAGKVRELRILEQLCALNEEYSPYEIQFYLSPHPTHGLMNSTINNDNVYDTQTNTWLMNNKRHTKAINVYVTKEAASGNTPPNGGTVLAYYSPAQDWVVSRKDQINGNGNGTIAHEFGHFFSLAHTFLGYESDPFDAADAGWPNAPAVSPGGYPTEKQNGSNSATAADKIADTPPDYNFGYIWSGCSAYTGGAKDPTGEVVDPMEINFMSYFSGCEYDFTPGQVSAMNADIASVDRNYLDNSFVPVATTFETPANLLVSPIGNDTTAAFDQVNLTWNAVTGATYYLVEIDITSGFATASYQAFIVNGTSKTLTNLLSNKLYYWRVKPFNEYYTCADAKASSFRTAISGVSGTNNIKVVQDWHIQPNPTQSNNNVQLFVNAERAFEANVIVTDASGKQIFADLSRSFVAGENSYILNTNSLSNGIYFVSLISGEARMTQRLVIIE
jgi:hypothetical protein